MPPPKQKPMTASDASGARRLSSSSPARRSAMRRSLGCRAEGRRGVALARQARRAALRGEQVDGERGVAVGGEAGRDRADVLGEATVLVDHEHGASWRLGRRQHADQLTVGTGEADLLADGRRPGTCR